MALTKEAYKILNSDYQGVRFIRPFEEYTIQDIKDLIEIFNGYILKLNARIKMNNARIKMNKKLMGDSKDAIIISGLEHENTALEFALMLLEGEIK